MRGMYHGDSSLPQGYGDYGSKYWLPGGFPDWNYSWYGRGEYLSGSCPEYEKWVKVYQDLAAKYDKLPRKLGNIWGDDNERKADRYIADAKEAKSRGKSALAICKAKLPPSSLPPDTSLLPLSVPGGSPGGDVATMPPTGAQFTSTTGGEQGGGISTTTLLMVGAGALLLFALTRKKGEAAAAPASSFKGF